VRRWLPGTRELLWIYGSSQRRKGYCFGVQVGIRVYLLGVFKLKFLHWFFSSEIFTFDFFIWHFTFNISHQKSLDLIFSEFLHSKFFYQKIPNILHMKFNRYFPSKKISEELTALFNSSTRSIIPSSARRSTQLQVDRSPTTSTPFIPQLWTTPCQRASRIWLPQTLPMMFGLQDIHLVGLFVSDFSGQAQIFVQFEVFWF
jgi:hypothetical protein